MVFQQNALFDFAEGVFLQGEFILFICPLNE